MTTKATGRVTGKGGYNYTCPMCGFVIKRADAKLRWDKQLVCAKDWEPRHPSDFYRQKSDARPLDRTAPDADALSWTPVFGNKTTVLGQGAASVVANYNLDSMLVVTKFKVTILVTPPATTAGGAANTMTLPTTPTSAGTFIAMTSQGRRLGTGTVTAAVNTITLPQWEALSDSIVISGQYGT